MELLRFNQPPIGINPEDLVGIEKEGTLLRVSYRNRKNEVKSALCYHIK